MKHLKFIQLIVIISITCSVYGCHASALQYVRGIAERGHQFVLTSPSRIKDQQIDEYMDRLGAKVLEAARAKDKVLLEIQNTKKRKVILDIYDKYDIVVVNSATPNAWVRGDDYSCVTTPLLLQAETPEEIVAVLCHEYGHLHHGHLVERKEREYKKDASIAVMIILGGVADGMSIQAGTYNRYNTALDRAIENANLINRYFAPYRREDEFEADDYGMELYASMGLPLERYDDFFERVVIEYGDTGGQTHPSTTERLKRLALKRDQLISNNVKLTLDIAEFHSMQRSLREILQKQLIEKTFVMYEYDIASRGKGENLPSVSACGPFDEDSDKLVKNFLNIVWTNSEK